MHTDRPPRYLAIAGLLLCTFLPAGSVAQKPAAPKVEPGHVLVPAGQRMAIQLTAAERDYILNEMRFQLDMLYVISEGLSRDDMNTVAIAARRRGTDTLSQVPAAVYDKTPPAFRDLIRESRAKIDQIAAEAGAKAPREAMLRRVTELLYTCNSCHANWQLQVTAAAAKPGAR